MAERFSYSLFGLGIRSDIPLPDVIEGEAAVPSIEIRTGALPDDLPTAPGYNVTELGTVLNITRVARYLIREGCEIIVERDPAGSDRNVRLFLLGSALGAVLHQRGLLPLHANAIDIGGRAVAFAGHSGAGKSTIAAWFHDRAHQVVADDVCVIALEDDRPVAFPGLPRLRLWRDALEASGRAVDDFEASFDDTDKYDVPTGPGAASVPLPLDRIYFLERSPPEAGEARIRRLIGVEAVDAIISNTYRGAYVRAIGRTEAHLKLCLRLARAVPVFSAERMWGYDAFDEQARLLERHARGALADAG